MGLLMEEYDYVGYVDDFNTYEGITIVDRGINWEFLIFQTLVICWQAFLKKDFTLSLEFYLVCI